MLLREAFEYRFNRDVVLSRPCIYGVFSGPLGGFRPREEKCVGCMRCVQEYPHIARIDRNPEFEKLGDSYWSPESVATVWNEAETGKIPVRGMGYKGPFAGKGFDAMWTDMSEIVRPTRDGKHGREFISTVVDIGRKPSYLRQQVVSEVLEELKVIQVSVPILFDILPRTSSSGAALLATSEAAKSLNTLCIAAVDDTTTESAIGEYSERVVPLVRAKDVEDKASVIERCRMVEFLYDNSHQYEQVEDRNPSCITVLRIPFRKGVEEEVVKLVKDGVGVIHLHADYHGREYESGGPRFITDSIRAVHSRLVQESIRDEVTLIISGGIILAEHVPKAIICGADLVAIDTAIMVALGFRFEADCRSPENCRMVPPRIDPEWGRRRLVNLVAAWHEQLIEILSAMGMRDVRRLRGETGRSMLNEDLEKAAFGEVFGYPQS